MGRKPNPLILEFFERGAKLRDNSNRYHHRCKACGEDFPKGRIDSLTTHLTKRCPAISEEDRVNACLALHGIHRGPNRTRFDGLLHSGPNAGPATPPALAKAQSQATSQSQDPIWTPLETLAEVSRQIEANEKHDDHVPSQQDPTAEAVRTTLAAAVPAAANTNSLELHEQFTLENPPTSLDNRQRDNKGMPLTNHWQPEMYMYQQSPYMGFTDATQKPVETAQPPLSAEERLRQILQNAGSPSQSTLSVAAAATARLNPSLLDPQLIPEEAMVEPTSQPQTQPQPQPQAEAESHPADMMIEYPPSPDQPPSAPASTNTPATPWEGMTYMAEGINAPATVNDHSQQIVMPLNRGGFRMDTSNGPHGARHRHSRARFESGRRKQVQEVRRIGACIRCRILRKTCSPGTPCDACKKVLSPRVWLTGCVRTKLCDYINLYSAKVQAVMSQKRISSYKDSHELENMGGVVEVSHFPETGHKAVFQVLQETQSAVDGKTADSKVSGHVLLLDFESEEISGKVETYMRQTLSELVSREPSHYIRVTLEIAAMVAEETNDELLKRSIELWGIVDMMDRERQWTMLAKSPKEGVEDYWIKDDTDSEAYTNICMQLTAAAEHKADIASKNLLKGIQQKLQDGKIKLGFPMFLTVMLFLNCLEKTTWAFQAWEEENLRPKWPLQKPPSSYTHQGEELMELLRMLLDIRHVLPKTTSPDAESPLVANESDPMIQKYFEHLGVTPAYLVSRLEHNFQPTDSRSLEFLFCAPLLLKLKM
ncbi:hypothetical protein GGR52DRAFT_549662 [Hypoxylon sp. FL1284]|nr:hypothetical protein GGR52DRAFT_549662 [Hypoxylon sp. FL1284]